MPRGAKVSLAQQTKIGFFCSDPYTTSKYTSQVKRNHQTICKTIIGNQLPTISPNVKGNFNFGDTYFEKRDYFGMLGNTSLTPIIFVIESKGGHVQHTYNINWDKCLP